MRMDVGMGKANSHRLTTGAEVYDAGIEPPDQMTPVRFRFLLYEKMKPSSTSLVLMWLMVGRSILSPPISCHW